MSNNKQSPAIVQSIIPISPSVRLAKLKEDYAVLLKIAKEDLAILRKWREDKDGYIIMRDYFYQMDRGQWYMGR
jgi:hypothetical protein